jgi:3-oxoacyl-[acyl-carrier protein] reductase
MLDFTGKTVLITGANGAIGRAASELFHRHHANVVLTDLDRDAIERFAVEAKLHDARLLALQQDARSAEHAEAAVTAAVERFGGLNYLITAAGYLRRQAVLELTDEQMSEMLAVNFLGVFATCRAAARVMQPGSAIVNLTSLAAHTGRKHGSHYAAAKGAVLAFTKSLAVELAPGIRVNAVSPGFIDTALSRPVVGEQGDALLQQIPMHRLGTPIEVAHLLVFLCSDWASYVTGQTLHVNGGLYVPG